MWPWRRNSDIRQSSTRGTKLQGSPLHPRTKTYAGEAGYAYQYVYLGWRRIAGGNASEYIFAASRERGSRFHITVCLADSDVSVCEASIGRQLSSTERYAIAKMTLFSAFDSVTDIVQFASPISPGSDKILHYLNVLDRV